MFPLTRSAVSTLKSDVEKILHPTIPQSKFDHRFELLGDSRFATVAPEFGPSVVQDHRVFSYCRCGEHDISEAPANPHLACRTDAGETTVGFLANTYQQAGRSQPDQMRAWIMPSVELPCQAVIVWSGDYS